MTKLITKPTFRFIARDDEYGEIEDDIQVVYYENGENLELTDEFGGKICKRSKNLSKFVKEVKKHLKEVQEMKK